MLVDERKETMSAARGLRRGRGGGCSACGSACGSGADDVVVDGSAGSASGLDSALLRRTQEVLRVVRGRHSWVLYPRIVVTNSG